MCFQLYCGQWLGQDRVLCGGSDNNMVRIVDRTTLAVSALFDFSQLQVYVLPSQILIQKFKNQERCKVFRRVHMYNCESKINIHPKASEW